MNDHTAPYAALDPACIFDALDSVGARSDGRLLALRPDVTSSVARMAAT